MLVGLAIVSWQVRSVCNNDAFVCGPLCEKLPQGSRHRRTGGKTPRFRPGDALGAAQPQCYGSDHNLNLSEGERHFACAFPDACWSPSRPKTITVPSTWRADDMSRSFSAGGSGGYTTNIVTVAPRSVDGRPDPATVVLPVDGVTVLAAVWQDHMPNVAEVVMLTAGVLTRPDDFETAPASHLLIEVIDPQPIDHPRAWYYTLLDILVPRWRAMLFSRPALHQAAPPPSTSRLPVGGTGLLRAGTPLEAWLDAADEVVEVLLPDAPSESRTTVNELDFRKLSAVVSSDYTVCFEKLWLFRGKWAFDSKTADVVRSRAHSVLGLPKAAPRHLCLLNRQSRGVGNPHEILSFLKKTSRSRMPVHHFVLDGLDPTEQAAKLGLCALTISPHGAQLTNAIWMPRGAVVIEVHAWSMIPMYHRFFKNMAVKAGLHHVDIFGDIDEMRPYIHDKSSCGDCWNNSWFNFTQEEYRDCTSGPNICHGCAKHCATQLNVTKHRVLLTDLVRKAEALGALTP